MSAKVPGLPRAPQTPSAGGCARPPLPPSTGLAGVLSVLILAHKCICLLAGLHRRDLHRHRRTVHQLCSALLPARHCSELEGCVSVGAWGRARCGTGQDGPVHQLCSAPFLRVTVMSAAWCRLHACVNRRLRSAGCFIRPRLVAQINTSRVCPTCAGPQNVHAGPFHARSAVNPDWNHRGAVGDLYDGECNQQWEQGSAPARSCPPVFMRPGWLARRLCCSFGWAWLAGPGVLS